MDRRRAPDRLGPDLGEPVSELSWPAATEDDEPCRFMRAQIIEIAKRVAA